jgi:hypothetical protein
MADGQKEIADGQKNLAHTLSSLRLHRFSEGQQYFSDEEKTLPARSDRPIQLHISQHIQLGK